MSNEVLFSWVKEEITGYIYCVTFGNEYENPIKIGYATNIDLRLSDLQIGNPYSLYVLSVAPGNMNCESFSHNLLYQYRVRNEWFWPTSIVRKFVGHMQNIEKSVRDGYWKQVRHVIQEQSKERLIDIVPGIRAKDLNKVFKS